MALKAADGSGSRRCAVCRLPLGAVCVVGVSVVRFFKEIGQYERPNPQNFPVGSQSSRRLAALGRRAFGAQAVVTLFSRIPALSATLNGIVTQLFVTSHLVSVGVKIDTTEHNAMIGRGRLHSQCHFFTCVKRSAFERGARGKSALVWNRHSISDFS